MAIVGRSALAAFLSLTTIASCHAFHPSTGHTGTGFAAAIPNSRPAGASAASASHRHPIAASNHLSSSSRPSRLGKTTALGGKVWDKLNIDPDPPGEHHWYLLNCIAGKELELLAQCQKAQPDMNPDDVVKFVVPQERKLRSHGKRNVVDVKALYPGYVFAKIRLCPETYETIQKIPLTRSWMGTVHMKGMKRLPVIPVSLQEDEIKKFKGLEADTEAMFEKYGSDYDGRGDEGEDLLDQYKGYEVDNMVKVLVGKHKGEDAVVKRLKDGKIKVALYTYGSTFEEWYDPSEIRPMTDAEVLRGLTGPDVPINQDQFDVSIGKKPKDYGRRGAVDSDNRRGNLRNDLMSSMSGGGGGGRRRMGRDSRQARGERGAGRRDDFGRTREEAAQEEKNWREYREQQRRERREGTWGMKGDKPWMYEETVDVTGMDDDGGDDGALGDVDAQWGRGGGDGAERRMRRQQQPQQQGQRGGRQWQDAGPSNRRPRRSEGVERALDADEDWMSFAGGDNDGGGGSKSSSKKDDDMDDFFDSLMSELSSNLDEPGGTSTRPAASSTESSGGGGWSPRPRSGSGGGAGSSAAAAAAGAGGASTEEDDFFASLMDDLSDTLDGPSGGGDSSTGVEGRAGAGAGTAASSSAAASSLSNDDFFASLEQDLSDSLDAAPAPSGGNAAAGRSESASSPSADDDFFASLEADLGETLGASDAASAATTSASTSGDDDFFASLEEDLSTFLGRSGGADSSSIQETPAAPSADDDFFASLEADLGETLGASDAASAATTSATRSGDDDFFASLEEDLSTSLGSGGADSSGSTQEPPAASPPRKKNGSPEPSPPTSVEAAASGNTASGGDLSKLTVPVLKGMLKERGLKVSGRKAELIERLQGGM